MNIELVSYFLVMALVIFGIFKNSITLHPIQFKCENYILNTYLYLILSWAVIMSTNAVLSSYDVQLHDLFSSQLSIVLMIGCMGLLMAVMFVPATFFFSKHALYMLELILLGLFVYPHYVNNKTAFTFASLSALAIIVILSLGAFLFPDKIKDSWGMYLGIGLISLFVVRIVDIFLPKKKPRHKWIAYLSVVLFSIYILYDTKRVLEHSKTCVNADYINEAMGLFLDSFNIFVNSIN
tara:strand:+ start:9230 stop:9940 length:711 start_codon:yes stop_codon:yes gene_type:complete